MNKNVKKLNEQQLVNLITNITKKYLNESLGIEAGLEGEPMEGDRPLDDDITNPIDNPIEQEYDDFFAPEENPAEEGFDEDHPDFEHAGWPYDSGRDMELDKYLNDHDSKALQEKQEKLLATITENWNNHANNLIK